MIVEGSDTVKDRSIKEAKSSIIMLERYVGKKRILNERSWQCLSPAFCFD